MSDSLHDLFDEANGHLAVGELDEAVIEKVRGKVAELCKKFPVYG